MLSSMDIWDYFQDLRILFFPTKLSSLLTARIYSYFSRDFYWFYGYST